jgi:hypothetical protein
VDSVVYCVLKKANTTAKYRLLQSLKKIGLKKLENILNITPEEETAVKNVFNRLNTGVDPSQMSELAQQVYSKEINTVKNLVDRIPKPIKAAGKFFTFGDMMFIKHGDSSTISLVEDEELTEEQVASINKFKKAQPKIKSSEEVKPSEQNSRK